MQLIASALEPAAIADIISKIKPAVNPLSQADIDRLNNYIARLKMGQRLSVQESQDFYRVTDIITHEYPNNEGSWLLALVSGILLGALLAKK
jgi:hypothetical protein